MGKLTSKSKYTVAVVGATGAVGTKMLEILAERSFPTERVIALASARSAGSQVQFAGKTLEVGLLDDEGFSGVDLAFFAAGGKVSRAHVERAASAGAVVIDKSSVYRMDPQIPLVVPEINATDIEMAHRGIIANPNCSTSQLVVAIDPLHREAGLTRLIVDTYQAVSGAGLDGIEDLQKGASAVLEGRQQPAMKTIAKPIGFSAVPHIDSFKEGGHTGEELKVVHETRKIMHLPELAVCCTAVRVPVFVGHCEAVTMQFERPLSPDRAREILASTAGVVVMDDPAAGVYPTVLDAEGRDEVFVGRIREDLSFEGGLQMWVVSDNLRKGAATNAVQIAEHAIKLLGTIGDRSRPLNTLKILKK